VKNGLFAGTSAKLFSPDISMTRAMYVTVMGRLNGIESTDYSAGGFPTCQVTAGIPLCNLGYENGIITAPETTHLLP
jgi:hypothetical protein